MAQNIAVGLVSVQFLLAPWTTPRGDNDGLWVLIIPLLAMFALVLYLVTCVCGRSTAAIVARRHRPAAPTVGDAPV